MKDIGEERVLVSAIFVPEEQPEDSHAHMCRYWGPSCKTREFDLGGGVSEFEFEADGATIESMCSDPRDLLDVHSLQHFAAEDVLIRHGHAFDAECEVSEDLRFGCGQRDIGP